MEPELHVTSQPTVAHKLLPILKDDCLRNNIIFSWNVTYMYMYICILLQNLWGFYIKKKTDYAAGSISKTTL